LLFANLNVKFSWLHCARC